MAKVALALLLMVGLAGCDLSGGTPLSHAIAALRAGNREDFLRAKKEAQDALRSAWQPGMDRCKLAATDFQKYGEASLIEKLDHQELFTLSENARFVYMTKVAGTLFAAGKEIEDGSGPTAQSLLIFDPGQQPSCSLVEVVSNFGLSSGFPGEEERRSAIKTWQDDLHARIGADGFGYAMENAVAELDNAGLSADWVPPQLEDDPNVPSFSQVMGKMKQDEQGR
jgi:hypothetical protein